MDKVIFVLLGIIAGIFAGYFLRKNSSEKKIGSAEKMAQDIINDASRTAEASKKKFFSRRKTKYFA